MSLYKDASLVMIPSAYKDGKLYSIRPTDGSGDFTFSRGSNLAATRVDVNGLIEKGRENLLYPSDLSAGVGQVRCSITPNAADPYGGTEAVQFITSLDASTTHYILKNVGIAAIGQVMTMSVTAKANGYDFFRIEQGNNSRGATFNLSDGTIDNYNGIAASIESVGNGWYRCSVAVLTISTAFAWVALFTPTSSASYTGDGVSGGFLYGAQLELGLVATDYIETGASTAQAGILEDMPRLDYSGSCPALLLEPQRTNFVTDSEYFAGLNLYGSISATYGAYTNPSGNDSAYLLEATSAISRIQTLSSTGDGNSAVMSIFIKGNDNVSYPTLANQGGGQYTRWEFDANNVLTYYDGDAPSGDYGQEDYGNGWYRIWLKTDTINGSTNYYRFNPDNRYGVGSLYAWGFQVEKNSSYPTSYIPTYGSSVTRSYDNLEGASYNDILSPAAFTLFFDFGKSEVGTGSGYIYRMDVSGTNNDLDLYQNPFGGGGLNIYLSQQGGYIFGTNGNDGWNVDASKVAISYDGDRLAYFINGSLYNSTTGISFTDADTKVFFKTTNSSPAYDLKQYTSFPTALTDSECIALTTI